MAFEVALNALLSVFVFLAIGYLAGRLRVIQTEQNKLLSRFVFYVSLPCLVLALFGGKSVLSGLTWGLVALNALPIVALIAALLLAGRVFRLGAKATAAFILAAAMPNSAFIGFPVVQLVFGDVGMGYALLIGPLHLILTLLLAVPAIEFLLKKKGEGYSNALRKVVTHPIILAIALGVILNVLGILLPGYLQAPIQSIGSSTVPIALFSIGLFIEGVRFKREKLLPAFAISALRLVPYAILVFLLAPILAVGGTALQVSLLLSMMPVAVLSFVLSSEYGLDSEAMALGIMLTTLLLPVPVYLIAGA